MLRRLVPIAVLAATAACSRNPRSGISPTPVPAPPTPASIRAIRSTNGSPITIDEIAALSMHVGFVFFGEQHDDPETHFAEFALLDALAHRGANVVVSLEMFERDVQP